jgi:hypothetical protein
MLTDAKLAHPDELNSGHPACTAGNVNVPWIRAGPHEHRSFIHLEV